MCEPDHCLVAAYAALLAAAADLRACHHPHHKQDHFLVAGGKEGKVVTKSFWLFCFVLRSA